MAQLFRSQRPGVPHLPSLSLLRAVTMPIVPSWRLWIWDSDAFWALCPGLDRSPPHTHTLSVSNTFVAQNRKRKRVTSPSSTSGRSPTPKCALSPLRPHGLAPFLLRSRPGSGRAARSRSRRDSSEMQTSQHFQAGNSCVPHHLPSEAQAPDARGHASFLSPGWLLTLRPLCLLLQPPIRLIRFVFFPVYSVCISKKFRGTAASCHYFSSPRAGRSQRQPLLSSDYCLNRTLVLPLLGCSLVGFVFVLLCEAGQMSLSAPGLRRAHPHLRPSQ